PRIVTSLRGRIPEASANSSLNVFPPPGWNTSWVAARYTSSTASPKNTATFTHTRRPVMRSSLARPGRVAGLVVDPADDEFLDHLVELLVLDHLGVPVVPRGVLQDAVDRALLLAQHAEDHAHLREEVAHL